MNSNFIQQISKQKLIPLSASVEPLLVSLPSESRSFLLTTGLPDNTDEKLKNLLLLTFYHTADKIRQIEAGGENYLIIGDQEQAFIGINERNGKVFAVDDIGQIETRLINSNVEVFIQFLDIYFNYAEKFAGTEMEDEQFSQVIGEMKTKFQQIDAEAVSDKESFWAITLFELENGLR